VLVHSDKKIISAMIPIEQLEYAQKVFLVMKQETTFEEDVILQKNQSLKMSMIRYVIVYILFRKFPDASTLFLAGSIKRDRTRVLSILNTIHNRYLSTVLKEQEDVKEFWGLVNKIKSKLNS
jgi:predicted transcriptional regulator with HTH domain